jgi:hypothetical protein
LRRRSGIESATFVFDGGMSGQINLQAMNEAGLSCVTRLSNATLRLVGTRFYEGVGEVAGEVELNSGAPSYFSKA